MTEYEILLLLDPELAEEKQAEVVGRLRTLIEKGGGTFERHDVWGRRQLAYEIDKKEEGVYHLLTFTASPETLDELSRVLKIDDDVMRHMATRRPEGGPSGPIAVGARDRRRCRDQARGRPGGGVMAGDINRVTLVGRLTRDPELRHIPSGTAVLELGLAVNGRQQDDAGTLGRQAELLRRQGLRPARPRHSPSTSRRDAGRRRRPPRLALVGGAGRDEALEGRRRGADTCSSSTAAATARSGGGGYIPRTPAPRRPATSRRPRPTTTSRSRRPRWLRRPNPRKRPGPGTTGGRRKSCHFCKDKVAGGGLQERQPAPALHLGEGQDPQPPHHRRVPPPPAAGRGRGEAGPRDGAPARTSQGARWRSSCSRTSRSSA